MDRQAIHHMASLILLCNLALAGCVTGQEPGVSERSEASASWYKPASAGSNALYSPASAFFDYTFDTLQLGDNFSTDNFGRELSVVWDRLRHPKRSIEAEGGFRRFVNREIFPLDSENRCDSFAALPNYGLHLLGDGMAYRRDLDWFRAHGYRYPRLAAVTLAMVSEVLQEALEVQETTEADAIADVYLFRPLGILLFSQDRIARAIQRHLQPAIWPSMTSLNTRDASLFNTGLSYIYRPPALSVYGQRVIVITGLNNMIGLSHRLQSGRDLSWTVGAAVEQIVRQRDIQADIKPSVGLFIDQNGSLIASAVFNDAGITRFRLSLFPGSMSWLQNAGMFFSITDDGELTAGVKWRLPLGIGTNSGSTATDVASAE